MTPCRNTSEGQSQSVASPTAREAVGVSACPPPDRPQPWEGWDFSDLGTLVSFPYGHIPLQQGPPDRSEKGAIPRKKVHLEPSNLRIYPHGFSYKGETVTGIEGSVTDVDRGEIEGFSKKAASRLRSFLVENWGGPNTWPHAVSLTTRRNNSPEEWRSITHRFRVQLGRKYPSWAAAWRVELQKREAPHLHCVFWVHEHLEQLDVYLKIRDLWLKCAKEENDCHSRENAVVSEMIMGGKEAGWLVYQALHDTKHKASQLGWKGKQWGIWNRASWQSRTPLAEGEFTESEMVWFVRLLRRWDFASRRASNKPEIRKKARINRFWVNHGGMRRVIPSAVTGAVLIAMETCGFLNESNSKK